MKSRRPADCTLVFDLGRVLIDFDETRISRRILESVPPQGGRAERISLEELYLKLFNSDILERFEKGKLSPKDFFGNVRERFGLEVSYRELVKIWCNIFTEKPEMIKLVRKLRRLGYELFLLSNIDVLHHQYVKRHFKVLDYFSRIFLSYQMGMAKPEARVYRRVVRAAGRPARDVFYVDDREEFVEAGRTQGLSAVLFQGAARLKKDLADFGIKLSASGQQRMREALCVKREAKQTHPAPRTTQWSRKE